MTYQEIKVKGGNPVTIWQLVVTSFGVVMTVFMAFLMWSGKTSDRISDISARTDVLQSQYTTQTEWRDGVQKEIKEIKDIVTDIRIQLANK